jgi:pimeloyl-ACP methyl ester carboxylesterase
MPTVLIEPQFTIFFEDDWFGEPWREPEPIVLIHGVAESSQAWYGWMSRLTPEFRVVRPDLPGFGRSSIPPAAFDWSMHSFASTIAQLLDRIGIVSAHIVGAKVGGSIAMQFAVDYPQRTRTLVVSSAPFRTNDTGGSVEVASFAARIRAEGVKKWAAETQPMRLGRNAPREQVQWWNDMMASTDPEVCIAATTAAGKIDLSDALSQIEAPTLIITTDDNALMSLAKVREYQQKIPRSQLLVLPSDSYHPAATRPAECAAHVLSFIAGTRA